MRRSGNSRHLHIQPHPKLLVRLLMRVIPAFYYDWMLLYSAFFAAVLFLAIQGLDWICSALISTTGHAALTSSNIRFFLRSWQGYALILIFLAFLGLVGAVIMNGIIFFLTTCSIRKRYGFSAF